MATDNFPTTKWTLVREAADANDPARAADALRRLCEHYYEAIIAYMQSAGLGDRAEDRAHDFIHRWLNRDQNPLKDYQERKESRFRNFLSHCLKNFLHERRRMQLPTGPLEEAPEPATEPSTGDGIDRYLAQAIAHRALLRLRTDWSRRPGLPAFNAAARLIFLNDATPQAQIAREHRCALSTVKSWVIRLRREYGDLFRQEAARLAEPQDVGDEFRHLIQLAPFRDDGSSFYATLHEIFR